MLGAITGDVIGSVYEWHNTKSTDFPLFGRMSRYTDDTVLTIAIADALLHKKPKENWLSELFAARASYRNALQRYARMFPDAGYGQMFEEWAKTNSTKPYRSYAASMAGGIAHAFYKEIPHDIWSSVEMKLEWKFRNVIKLFAERYTLFR